MKIRSEKKCWIPKPPMSWSAGEVQEVSEEVGKKLLINQNFSKVSAKPEIKRRITQNYE